MMLLVNKSHRGVASRYRPGIGRLVMPRHYSSLDETDRMTWWAADNDAFGGFDADRFRIMLEAIREQPRKRLLWIAAPDVVGDHEATMEAFEEWRREIQPLPIALVLQDGLTEGFVPWDQIDAVFVGGSTEYKLGEDAARIVKRANELGKWTHMGRVNTQNRIRYANSIGCDSIDGTALSMYTDTYLASHYEIAHAPPQERLEFG